SCPKCGTLNTPTAKFCSSCGAELHPTQAERKTQILTCPKCGAENKAGSKFCQNCGEPLSKE
ncbi:zinc ribbon domain-containing protein, partial [bacterium]|nr:zinc ribbon domain-containing protein [bacterium]